MKNIQCIQCLQRGLSEGGMQACVSYPVINSNITPIISAFNTWYTCIQHSVTCHVPILCCCMCTFAYNECVFSNEQTIATFTFTFAACNQIPKLKALQSACTKRSSPLLRGKFRAFAYNECTDRWS